MQFSIKREELLAPLQILAGVVEKRQTLPILGNILLQVKDGTLSMTGTDLEVEIVGKINVPNIIEDGETTVSARKLMDICRALPDGSPIDFSFKNDTIRIKSGKSRFNLTTLPPNNFPNMESAADELTLKIAPADLRYLFEKTSFAMAQQDVRFYMNGLLLELSPGEIKTVSTDGHRLALCTLPCEAAKAESKVIIPRKAVLELNKLLADEKDDVEITIGANQIQVATSKYKFTSKLIDSRFPDYNRVLPRGGNKVITVQRDELKESLKRVGVLVHERHRGIRVQLNTDRLQLIAINAEQEMAEEQVNLSYDGEDLAVGFNVGYLLEILNAMEPGEVRLTFSDQNTGLLIEETKKDNCTFVAMPMHL